MNFKDKNELIEFIKNQCGTTLPNEDCFLNGNDEMLYTKIPLKVRQIVFPVLEKYGIQTNKFDNDNYFIYLRSDNE